MTATPELILYRASANDPDGINEIPERLHPFLDSCRQCADGDLYTPVGFDRYTNRTVASYLCDEGHAWTRGYINVNP